MSNQAFGIGGAVEAGWEATKGQLGFLMVLVIVSVVLWMVPGGLQAMAGDSAGVAAGGAILGFVLSALVNLGWARIGLLRSDGREGSFEAFFGTMGRIVTYIFASILAFVAVGVGFALLVIPGIYLAVKLSLFSFVIVDDPQAGPMDALKESWRLTDGVWWQLFLFYLVTGLINTLGAVLVGVGLLVTIPLTIIAWARVFRSLSGGAAPAAEAAAAQAV